MKFQPQSVQEHLFFTTVRLIASPDEHFSTTSIGTGFFYSYYTEGNNMFPFIVTNKHIVEGSKYGIIELHRFEDQSPILGTPAIAHFEDFTKAWIYPDNPNIDIAIMPFGNIQNNMRQQGIEIYYDPIPQLIVPTKEQYLQEINAIEDVLFIGYPAGIYDRKNYIPIARKGITATPISIDYEGEPVFLISASIFPGSSGSPVFLYNVGGYSTRNIQLVAGTRILFLGILSRAFYLPNNDEENIFNIIKKNQDDAFVPQMIDLGIVYKSEVIKEFIEDILRKQRKID